MCVDEPKQLLLLLIQIIEVYGHLSGGSLINALITFVKNII